MMVHRSIATSFEKPSIDMPLDIRLTFPAQSQKAFLYTVSSRLDISIQQSQCIGNQRTFQPFERGVQPQSMVVAGRRAIAVDFLGRGRLGHVGMEEIGNGLKAM